MASRCAGTATLHFDRGCIFFHADAMQTVNEASRNAKTLKLHSEVRFEHEGAEVRTTSRNSAPFKVAEVASASASSRER
jgi:hypothetical protein